MRFKKRSNLGVYQSKTKRRKRMMKEERQISDDIETVDYNEDEVNDDTSTVPYSNGEPNLSDVLDRMSMIGDEMLSSITTEHSDSNSQILNMCINNNSNEDVLDVSLNSSRESIMQNIRKYIVKDNTKEASSSGSENGDDADSDENNSEEEHDIETCSCHIPEYLEYAVNVIQSKEILVPMVKHMNRAGVLDDFLILIDKVSKGTLEANNLPLTLAVEFAKFQNCSSSTGMRYRKETLDFWNVFYRTCHGAGLNLASGSKHRGHVVGKLSRKGKYKPDSGSFNWIVPDPKTLLHHQKRVDKYIYSGIIEGSFDLVDKMKQYVLEYDGKRLSSGLGEFGIGDVNLWGLEKPSQKSMKDRLEEEMDLLKDLSDVEDVLNPDIVKSLHLLLLNITKRIQTKRTSLVGHYKYLTEVTKMCDSNKRLLKKYNKSIKDTKGMIILLKNWIQDALSTNKKICWLLADINNSIDLVCLEDVLLLNNQPNVKLLYSPEQLEGKVDMKKHTHIVKQRTEKWHELRNIARVTGSSMYKAVGLDSLKSQKEHYDVKILGKKETKPSADVQELLDYGTKNEINGIGTLTCLFMPAFMPACATYVEDGANFINGDKVHRLMEVSTDGIIRCCKDSIQKECYSLLDFMHEDIIVEVKCKFPREGQNSVYYELPDRYVTQILSGMKCKKVTSCIFVSYSAESTTFSKCTFDLNLWQEMWGLCKEFYDDDHCIKPSCLHPETSELKQKIKQYIKSNTQLLCELPSQRTEQKECDIPARNPYIPQTKRKVTFPNNNQLIEDLNNCIKNATDITKSSFQLCRKRAFEILTFIIGDSDRNPTSSTVSHIPIAYGMKGYSLRTETMREMIEIVRNTCKEKGVDIVCEVCDGQWAKIVFNSIEYEPLTRLQLQKKIWNDSMKVNKKDMIHTLLNTSQVGNKDLKEWSEDKYSLMVDGVITKGNITVEVKYSYNSKKLTVLSSGGSISNVPLMTLIQGQCTTCYPQLWKRTKKKMKQEEITREQILEYIPSDIILMNSGEYTELNNDEEDGDMIITQQDESDISTDSEELHECNLLEKIIHELRKLGKKKSWQHISAKSLYRYHLCDAEAIHQSFIVPELDIINKVTKEVTGKKLFNRNEPKNVKVNKISTVIGNKSIFPSVVRRQIRIKTLKDICYKKVMSGDVPKTVIACSLARIESLTEIPKWESESTVPMYIDINHLNETFQMYCYPEFSKLRKQVEPRTLDATHLLTNLRSHMCRKGFTFFDRDALLRVCDKDNNVLPRSLVTDILDLQNVEFAVRIFSNEVEEVMKDNGDMREAQFLRIVREWYEACDSRGISPLERVRRWVNMNNFLLNGLDFNQFPPPGNNVKGIPIITFEGIIQNISIRILLYCLCKDGTFNNRSISTNGIENFYSLLSRHDFTSTGCPKAVQIHKILPIMIDYNYHRNNPFKIFNMDPRRGAPYPFHNMDKIVSSDELSDSEENVQFKAHNFDKYIRKVKRRKKMKSTIGGIHDVERGKRTVRGDFYKLDESKLNVLQKLGLPDDTDV